MSQRFRILGRSTVYSGFTTLEVADLEVTFRSGEVRRIRREIETHGSGAAILPFDPVRRVAVMVRQLRVPIAVAGEDDAYPLEAIAGLLDVEGEGPEATARREAEEEAGLSVFDMLPVAATYSTPGISTEKLHLFLAEIDIHQARTGAGGGAAEEHEDIEVVVIPLAELAERADRGELQDLKTFALVQSLRLARPALFADIE
ncbi:NUDIX domain-containing protein [Prosthecodimorpha staleyi]|uniref:GDP-mannose pyrophosphatase n=1 Tax=Prosthecodimorpha staleyi TaxID=2840188 RepID=A0A947D025_9HYPH|nr:NUDIX domain-containing protein [Prosthecodimorpha staleyi]MBT9288448.1 NUDIX domain-containing protein [Prosthecodimorpha staleyi]